VFQLQTAIPYLRKKTKKNQLHVFCFFSYSSTTRFTTSDNNENDVKKSSRYVIVMFDKLSDVYIIIIVTFI